MTQNICTVCDGQRVVSRMEAVYPGEPHMADIGEQPCPDCCSGNTEDDYDPDDN